MRKSTLTVERIECKLATGVEAEIGFSTAVGNMPLFLRKNVNFSSMSEGFVFIKVKYFMLKLSVVVHACNPSYLGS